MYILVYAWGAWRSSAGGVLRGDRQYVVTNTAAASTPRRQVDSEIHPTACNCLRLATTAECLSVLVLLTRFAGGMADLTLRLELKKFPPLHMQF